MGVYQDFVLHASVSRLCIACECIKTLYCIVVYQDFVLHASVSSLCIACECFKTLYCIESVSLKHQFNTSMALSEPMSQEAESGYGKKGASTEQMSSYTYGQLNV